LVNQNSALIFALTLFKLTNQLFFNLQFQILAFTDFFFLDRADLGLALWWCQSHALVATHTFVLKVGSLSFF